MELRQLKYFLAAVEEGSIQGASRRVNVAQPAVSRQIIDLEERLGCKLFERSARGVQLTPAGASFHSDALSLFENLEMATVRARKLGARQSESIRLGLARSSSKYEFAHQALAGFRAEAGAVPIEFKRSTSPDLAEALRSRQIDISLIYERHLDPRAFRQRLIHTEDYVIALHPDHKLACKAHLSLSDLVGVPLVWLSRLNNTEIHDALIRQCRVHGLEPAIAHLAESHEELLELVSLSVGACITSASAVLLVPTQSLVCRPIPDFGLELSLWLVWSRTIATESLEMLVRNFNAAIDVHSQKLDRGELAWARLADGTTVAHSSIR